MTHCNSRIIENKGQVTQESNYRPLDTRRGTPCLWVSQQCLINSSMNYICSLQCQDVTDMTPSEPLHFTSQHKITLYGTYTQRWQTGNRPAIPSRGRERKNKRKTNGGTNKSMKNCHPWFFQLSLKIKQGCAGKLLCTYTESRAHSLIVCV